MIKKQKKNKINIASPGYIYLIEAKGFHGIFPGIFLKRCKIGKSINPKERLEDLQSGQPPCDYEIIATIHVKNMATTEKELHKIFADCKVNLTKSREYFDLTPWRYFQVLGMMNKRKAASLGLVPFLLAITAIASLLWVGNGGIPIQLEKQLDPISSPAKPL